MEITASTEMPIQTALSFLRWVNIRCMIAYMRLRIKTSLPVTLLVILTAVMVSVAVVRMARTTLGLSAELRAGEAFLVEMQKKKQALEARLAEADEPAVVEYQAKAALNLKNPGEEVVVVPLDERPVFSAESRGVWRRIMDFFVKMF